MRNTILLILSVVLLAAGMGVDYEPPPPAPAAVYPDCGWEAAVWQNPPDPANVGCGDYMLCQASYYKGGEYSSLPFVTYDNVWIEHGGAEYIWIYCGLPNAFYLPLVTYR